MIQFLTAGESHGKCLVGILEGVPAGLAITEAEINVDLARRQLGYGRGDRMKVERDQAQILTGVRYGCTTGAPIALMIDNRDWTNWVERMSIDAPASGERAPKLTSPRPGHADYAGSLKYRHDDIRNVIERSSARETTMRVALAGLARKIFREFGVEVSSHVVQIGGIVAGCGIGNRAPGQVNHDADGNQVRCLDEEATSKMIAAIDDAKSRGDTLGGVFEVVVTGLPVGIGSYVHWEKRLDGILAGAMMSIHAMKAVGFGMGFEVAAHAGSEVHDQMYGDAARVQRQSNNAGGTEGGMTNGEPVRIRVAMKPLSTLGRPLNSVDLATGEATTALRERSDVCAVPAAAVVGEAMALLALMNPFLEKFGGDSIDEIRAHIQATPPSPWA
jgi:chorismate synthase